LKSSRCAWNNARRGQVSAVAATACRAVAVAGFQRWFAQSRPPSVYSLDHKKYLIQFRVKRCMHRDILVCHVDACGADDLTNILPPVD
jgi:hypothetical protein